MPTLEDFKVMFSSRMVNQMINSGTPPVKHWPIPEFFKRVPTIMEALMSEEGHKMYLELSEDDQHSAIDFIENFGPYIAEIIGCPLFEDWDKTPIELSDEERQELRDKYKLTI